jgi:hypothetical protein
VSAEFEGFRDLTHGFTYRPSTDSAITDRVACDAPPVYRFCRIPKHGDIGHACCLADMSLDEI